MFEGFRFSSRGVGIQWENSGSGLMALVRFAQARAPRAARRAARALAPRRLSTPRRRARALSLARAYDARARARLGSKLDTRARCFFSRSLPLSDVCSA